jgi:hypothetical protein
MTIRTKSLLILVAAFLLGSIVGYLVNGMVVRQVRERWPDRRHMLFMRFYHRILDPSPEQKTVIDSILQEYGVKMARRGVEFRRGMKALADSLNQDIMPVLTPEQQKILESHFERLERLGPPGKPLPGRPRPGAGRKEFSPEGGPPWHLPPPDSGMPLHKPPPPHE